MNRILQLALLPVAIGIWVGFAALGEVAAVMMAPDVSDVWEDDLVG